MHLEGVTGVAKHWPLGRRRTSEPERQDARFRVDFDQAFDELVEELDRLDVENATICVDVDLRGMSPLPEPDDPGVVVEFSYAGQNYILACDKWFYMRNNLRAVGRALKRVRLTEQDGVCSLRDGLAPFRAAAPSQHWWQVVLGVAVDAAWPDVKQAYREAAKRTHPDSGPMSNSEAFKSVQRAYEAAKAHYAP